MFRFSAFQRFQASSQLSKKVRVRFLLSRCPASEISTKQFELLCTSPKETQHALSEQEAGQFLSALHEARVVIRDGERVFLQPVHILNRVHASLGIPPFSNSVICEKKAQLQREINDFSKTSTASVESTGLWRKRFWGTVAVGSGSQMAILAYLTFITYGWDTMEPACYFLTCATSLAFYLYFLLYRREQSLTQVDENLLPVKLQQRCTDANVNTRRWMDCLEEVDALTEKEVSTERSSENFHEWFRHHVSTK